MRSEGEAFGWRARGGKGLNKMIFFIAGEFSQRLFCNLGETDSFRNTKKLSNLICYIRNSDLKCSVLFSNNLRRLKKIK